MFVKIARLELGVLKILLRLSITLLSLLDLTSVAVRTANVMKNSFLREALLNNKSYVSRHTAIFFLLVAKKQKETKKLQKSWTKKIFYQLKRQLSLNIYIICFQSLRKSAMTSFQRSAENIVAIVAPVTPTFPSCVQKLAAVAQEQTLSILLLQLFLLQRSPEWWVF